MFFRARRIESYFCHIHFCCYVWSLLGRRRLYSWRGCNKPAMTYFSINLATLKNLFLLFSLYKYWQFRVDVLFLKTFISQLSVAMTMGRQSDQVYRAARQGKFPNGDHEILESNRKKAADEFARKNALLGLVQSPSGA